MAVTVEEKWESRNRTGGIGAESSSSELLWIINGTDDDQVAANNLIATTPPTSNGLPLLNTTLERLAEETWLGTANYGDIRSGTTPEVNNPVFTFDTTGGTDHITQSLETTSYPGGAPDSKGAIGDNGETVEGVDITTPVFNFTETHLIPVAIFTPARRATLFWATGRINKFDWKGFDSGEVLFLGATGSLRNADYWEINYNFAAVPNVVSMQIGDITGIDKRGWDYIDIRREKTEDGGHMVNSPFAIYVHKVYPEGDFGFLGIGI